MLVKKSVVEMFSVGEKARDLRVHAGKKARSMNMKLSLV